MKKKQYIATVACLVAGVIGFASVYATENAQKRRKEQQNLTQQIQQDDTNDSKDANASKDTDKTEQASNIVQPKVTKPQVTTPKVTDKKEDAAVQPASPKEEEEPADQPETPEAEQTINTVESLHFEDNADLVWPLEGNVLMNYSMNSTVYFATLDQYKYNPAVIIGGDVNSKVYLVAKGRISDIYTDEETGCTVVQDLGDGYSAVYGQLKEVKFEVGDMAEAGQVIGFVSEPTKYYSTEGSNLYFQLLKDGEPVNPLDYFE